MPHFIDPATGQRVEIESVPWGRRYPLWASVVALVAAIAVPRLLALQGVAWGIVFLVVLAGVRVGLRYWPRT